ncbi:MAG: ABC transporter permease [Caulobacterales bacterium]|jgi:ABC-2 type transport system permease protein|nr:ABC transporter permease [Caulobacterales bacterium]
MTGPRQLGWLGRIAALARKEAKQIRRDPSSAVIVLFLPLFLLFLFGYGISLDAASVRLGLVLEERGPEARGLAEAYLNAPDFDARLYSSRREAERALQANELRGFIVIPPDFSERLNARASWPAQIHVVTDGSQPNTAEIVANYSQGVLSVWSVQLARDRGFAAAPAISIEPRFWFNEDLRTRYNLVPGSIALVMTIIGTLLTALVVAREWERGTLEAVFATPVSAIELLASKLFPYFLLALATMAACVLAAIFLFGVPFRGSFLAILALTAAFLTPALGQGLLISSAAKNQFVASQLALFSGFLPAMLLSGFMFEIDSMPAPIRAITTLIPARYFVTGLQTVFLAGDVWEVLAPAILKMLALGAVLSFLAWRVTPKRIA